MKGLFLAVAGLMAAPAALAEPDYAPSVRADYRKDLGALFDHFHRNLELSFKEVNTAARMARELRAISGIEVTEEVGGTGVVGVMRNGAAEKAGGPPMPSHHSNLFKITPEPAITTGTIAMVAAVLDLMAPGATTTGGQ